MGPASVVHASAETMNFQLLHMQQDSNFHDNKVMENKQID